MPETVQIYTDGACRGNPGPGGWGAILRYKGIEKTLSGAELRTTNNQMELKAAIEGLNALKWPCKVVLHTDSEYLRKGITEWIHNWRKKNWKSAGGKAVKNQALWKALVLAEDRHIEVDWVWVKGHSGHPENELADALAREAIDSLLQNYKEI